MIEAHAKTPPVELSDESLAEANGGILIGLLLPAIQKSPSPPSGGGNILLGDGSVRMVNS